MAARPQTFATLAPDVGHDFRGVTEWLGHADYTTTLRVHWIPAEVHNSIALPAAPTVPANVISLASRRRSAG